jgi:putative transposase
MFKAYKYRIYPNADQVKLIEQTFGVCRYVYNVAMDIKTYAYRTQRISLSAIDLCYQLVDFRKEFDWAARVDSQALQASVKRIDRAFKNFYNGSGYPKFKSKHGKQSFQCPNNKREVKFENELLTIPKIKDIPIRVSRRFDGKIKTVTISRSPSGKYYASILVESDLKLPVKPSIKPETTIGIDLGVKSFVVTSDGLKYEPNQFLKKNLDRLKVLQQRAGKKKKGNSNRKKANKRVAVMHEKISSSRLDYIHKVSNALIRENQTESIAIENLNVSGMLGNHKLAQAIADVSMAKFYDVLDYKCGWYGKNLIQIGRFVPSSKRCSHCGHIKEDLTLADREWTCDNCRTQHDRDVNAAKNIRYFGLQQTIFNHKTGWGTSGEPVEQSAMKGCWEAGSSK